MEWKEQQEMIMPDYRLQLLEDFARFLPWSISITGVLSKSGGMANCLWNQIEKHKENLGDGAQIFSNNQNRGGGACTLASPGPKPSSPKSL